MLNRCSKPSARQTILDETPPLEEETEEPRTENREPRSLKNCALSGFSVLGSPFVIRSDFSVLGSPFLICISVSAANNNSTTHARPTHRTGLPHDVNALSRCLRKSQQ